MPFSTLIQKYKQYSKLPNISIQDWCSERKREVGGGKTEAEQYMKPKIFVSTRIFWLNRRKIRVHTKLFARIFVPARIFPMATFNILSVIDNYSQNKRLSLQSTARAVNSK